LPLRIPGEPLLAGQPHFVTGIHAGNHVISLLDSPHCSVETGPQPASVTAGQLVRDTVEVDFSVTCSPPSQAVGPVQISATSSGASGPYTVWFGSMGAWDYGVGSGTLLGTLDANGTLVAELPASSESGADPYWYNFELTGAPGNCRVESPNPHPDPGFVITPGDTLDIKFVVTCPP
jgi:hypothetical protein